MATALSHRIFPEPGFIRIGTVASIPTTLVQLGFDPDTLLAELDVDSTLFKDPNLTIPYEFRSKLLNLCVERTGCQHFGLLIGQNGDLSSLGWAGLLMQQTSDVGTALQSLVRFFHLHARGAGVYIEESGEGAFIGYSIFCHTVTARIQVQDGANALMFNFLRELCGPDYSPISVSFAHRHPVNTGPFQKFFGAPLVFDAERNGILFSRNWMKSTVSTSNQELHQKLRSRVEQYLHTNGLDFTDQIRRVLANAFFTHNSTAEQVAALFDMHPRTLNRRLNRFGTSFKKLSDQVRFEIAQQLLEDSSMKIVSITDALNYSEVAAFTRAFKRWSGVTPALWRARHQNELLLLDQK